VEAVEPLFEGNPLKSEPQERFRDETSLERIGWKDGREGGEEPRTWQCYSGVEPRDT